MANLKSLSEILRRLKDENIDPADVGIDPHGLWLRPDAEMLEDAEED